ncbi:MAG TPA: hypothetical protein VE999_01640 [Gemmataceae bacterium]|nr:hypothetical protein [Gemmataceae bacterium]
MADVAYMRSPHTGEIRQVEVTPEALSPLMSQGWTQVPAPAEQKPATPVEEEH